jgi:hypothetical protein
MRHTVKLLLLVLTAANTFVGADCAAQRGAQGARGWGAGSEYNRLYDVATVDTVAGEVVGIENFLLGRGFAAGTHITLRAESETISVHLGPTWFLDTHEMRIEVGDLVEVIGSRIIYRGVPTIIAARVKLGAELLELRDELGIPRWSRSRRLGWALVLR